MEKQKTNKFPLVKLFTVDGASCYLYDGRANMFLSLSETEKNLVCEYWRRMELLKESLARPPSLPVPPLSSPVLTETASCFRVPWKRGHLQECVVRNSYGNNGRRKPFPKN